ncbi:hypothetical protein QBC34DRAFT_442294 [Podospora aff. communis PSN243]|uniref:Uncharacterized protein n=1 Tax=Podospora aff. communis PSN243 TaxID=3040156 RepID=A0AAV9GC83_9PEZI|nr:hypothetical protein QBC34DRAFT_442294 [Podospora aff. communis PSN243]
MSLPRRQYRKDSKGERLAPDAIHSPPYWYGACDDYPWDDYDEFKLDDIAWDPPDRLAQAITSGDLTPDQKPPAKKWLLTQLRLYGIPHKKGARVGDLKDVLVKAWRNGKCVDLVPSIGSVRDRLQKQYDAAFELLEKKLYEDIGDNPSREAYFDARRFVAKYFQNAQGRPIRTKTPDALCFESWSSWDDGKHHTCLKEAVEAVPGLAARLTKDKAVVGWEGTIERAIEKEFSKLEEHWKTQNDRSTLSVQAVYQSKQANLDLGLFLRKTLGIDQNGKRLTKGRKPSAPILLSSWALHGKDVPRQIASKAPGLLAKECESITVIGWDENAIKIEVERLKNARKNMDEQERLEEEQSRSRKQAEKMERWERRSKPYRDLLARQRQPPNRWDIQHTVGSYIVHWHGEDQKGYGDGDFNDPDSDHDVMRIDIFPGKSPYGVKASFWFGLFEGIMLLATSRRNLERLREAQPKGNDSDEEESDRGADDGQSVSIMAGQKRTIGDISDPWEVQAARLKRQMMGGGTSTLVDAGQRGGSKEESSPGRVYFQFVANQIDGYPDVDDRNENLGHLDFDDTRLSANGQFVWPFFFGKESPQAISIFKVAEKPNPEHQPDEWYMYDGRSWGRW